MLRQAELWNVLGRRLTERLLRAGWIEPIASTPGAIFFKRHDVHLALKRLAKEGWILNGHVRSVSVSDRPKVPKQRSLEEAFADVDLDNVFPE